MDDKPVYRVGAAGLDPRDWRLIEIVFKHSRYNKYEFRLVDQIDEASIDILIANSVEAEGVDALARVRDAARNIPVIAAVPRGAPNAARHAISIERLTLQLLPILNRVVELELAPGRPATGQGDAPPSPGAVGPASGGGAPATPAATAPAPASARVPAPAQSPEVRASTRAPVPPPEAATPPARALQASPGHASGSRAAAQAAPADEPARSNLLKFPVQNGGEGLITQPLKVLVVDDSPTVRRQLSVAFDRLGLACEPVATAAEALRRLDEEHFDLALVDVVMPEMDGYRLTREIKRNKRLRQMPVIILTSRSSPFDLARGALAGCDTYLTKPVPFRALEAAVVRLLRKSLAIDDLTGLLRTSMPDASRTAAPKPVRPAERVARFFGR